MRGAPRRLLLLLLCAAACALKPIQRRRLLATSALLPASQAAALAPKPSPPPPPSYVREDAAARDLRAYRLLRFASGLRVLLASDASARDATVAATAVAASFDGNANAYTAFDCTTYVASCFPSRVGRLLAAYGDALSPRTADRFDGATARRERSAQWEEALTHALGAVAALRLTPLPLWKDAADECARLADLQWRFPPRPPTASELANDMRCADFDVLGARRYAAAPRDAALAASRFADLLTPERCRVAACLSELDARTVRTKLRRRRARRALYDAALAGCKYEFAFLRAAPNAPGPAAGARRARGLRGRAPAVRADYAAARRARGVADPGGGPRARQGLRAPRAGPRRKREAGARGRDGGGRPRRGRGALELAARAAPAFGEALVAAEDADEASAKKLVAAVYRELLPAYVPLATARAPAAPPADRPSRLLASRNSWDHPVAANACVASGVPGLLANCNVR
ncbi:M16 peptidase-like protein [Aureococcus anophagefferens]|nr:M16 peptidase-like protein [Aureococcus anophagefferens]